MQCHDIPQLCGHAVHCLAATGFTKSVLHPKFLHQRTFTPEALCTTSLLHPEALYTRSCLHQKLHQCFHTWNEGLHTKKLLHQKAFSPHAFYNLWHPFTRDAVYTNPSKHIRNTRIWQTAPAHPCDAKCNRDTLIQRNCVRLIATNFGDPSQLLQCKTPEKCSHIFYCKTASRRAPVIWLSLENSFRARLTPKMEVGQFKSNTPPRSPNIAPATDKWHSNVTKDGACSKNWCSNNITRHCACHEKWQSTVTKSFCYFFFSFFSPLCLAIIFSLCHSFFLSLLSVFFCCDSFCDPCVLWLLLSVAFFFLWFYFSVILSFCDSFLLHLFFLRCPFLRLFFWVCYFLWPFRFVTISLCCRFFSPLCLSIK